MITQHNNETTQNSITILTLTKIVLTKSYPLLCPKEEKKIHKKSSFMGQEIKEEIKNIYFESPFLCFYSVGKE